MNVKYQTAQVLKALMMSQNGLMAFTLYSRYGLKPSEAIAFMDQYSDEGIIEVDNDLRIRLTEKGKDSLTRILAGLGNAKNEPRKTVSNEYMIGIMAKGKMAINKPYLPKKEFYERLIRDKRRKELAKRSGVAPSG